MSETSTWQVRPALLADTEEIARIHLDSWRTAYRGLMPPELLEEQSVRQRYQIWKYHILKGRRGLVLEGDGSLEGFCMYGPSKEGDRGEIYAIHVHPGVWKRGGGSELYRRTAEALREMGFSDIEVRVLEGNEPACRFYEKHGLVSDGRVHEVRVAGIDLPHRFYSGRL